MFAFEPGSFLFEAWPARAALASGVRLTLLSTLLSIVLATLAGLGMGIALTYGRWWLRGPARLYVDFMRGMPVLVLILFTYYGQMDAAKAIGLTFPKRLAYVIVPQAARRMLPPWINTCLEVAKGTTLLSIIGVVDLLLASQQVMARNYMIIDFYGLATVIYLVINVGIAQAGALMERRFSYLRY